MWVRLCIGTICKLWLIERHKLFARFVVVFSLRNKWCIHLSMPRTRQWKNFVLRASICIPSLRPPPLETLQLFLSQSLEFYVLMVRKVTVFLAFEFFYICSSVCLKIHTAFEKVGSILDLMILLVSSYLGSCMLETKWVTFILSNRCSPMYFMLSNVSLKSAIYLLGVSDAVPTLLLIIYMVCRVTAVLFCASSCYQFVNDKDVSFSVNVWSL